MRTGIQFVLLSTYDFDKNAVCTILCRIVEKRRIEEKTYLIHTHIERPTQTHRNEMNGRDVFFFFFLFFFFVCSGFAVKDF